MVKLSELEKEVALEMTNTYYVGELSKILLKSIQSLKYHNSQTKMITALTETDILDKVESNLKVLSKVTDYHYWQIQNELEKRGKRNVG